MSARYWAVIPAAGAGTRMGAEVPKQYLRLRGKYILEHTLERFCRHPAIAGVVVATAADDKLWDSMDVISHSKVMRTSGGRERCHSVLNGLRFLAGKADADDWVLVHDAARPCVRHEDIDRMITGLATHPVGGILALPVRDTMKRSGDDDEILETVDRNRLWHALTPQMFRLQDLTNTLQSAVESDRLVTDEAQAVELSGRKPKLIAGHPDNIKITHIEDLALAELYMQLQESE